ncbi:conserved hypothetical protein; K09966 hypothetical protein [Pirellula staleyi DSM 6068]|uniref:DUF2237 domain-containing protein n=1 Tax=Pirellula staleyi (strain ATCC 27377 / DSM 6068 / ICPB 4128) TaxID=530564 RepID=D2R1N5_PIRSD|nr:DUF2237 domain-containing protein [Pirellula staleyi]ADB16754.1 conserved hypothetical protein; K09966 hypothetical protein [Pirellula staleyi DSM 6068]
MPGKNVLGENLVGCCSKPMTGFYRNGRCDTGPGDEGVHVVCAKMTSEFLVFSQLRGNDLSTPMPMYDFPGLKPGDCWCLCAARWKEAFDAGVAPPVNLAATHISALEFATLEELSEHALDAPESR